jgi:hypothetical protein
MATISKFKVGDLATYNYRLSDSEPPLLWSCVVTKVNAGTTYDVRFDGIQVPDGTVPGCPGPQQAPVIRAYHSQLTPRSQETGDALKAATWAYKVKAWTSAQEASRAARDVAWHADMCTRFGHIAMSRDRLPVSYTYVVEYGPGQEGSSTEHGTLISTDPNTFICTVEFSGSGKTNAVRIQDLVFL